MKPTKVSYIGKPKSESVMFIVKKLEHLLANLENVSHCLVFAEKGMNISDSLKEKHSFVMCDSPQQAYVQYVSDIAEKKFKQEQSKQYNLINGSWIGMDCVIDETTYIEPGCLIGHGVTIGKNGLIKTNTVIKNATIGNNFIAQEGAKIGCDGFTMAKNENGSMVRIPTLGTIIISDHVEVGANTYISAGSAGETCLKDYVKLDAQVYVAHDVVIGKNTQVAGGCILGGFSEIGENCFLGFSANIKNRIRVGNDSTIGMGAVVLKDVKENSIMVGNPAKPLIK